MTPTTTATKQENGPYKATPFGEVNGPDCKIVPSLSADFWASQLNRAHSLAISKCEGRFKVLLRAARSFVDHAHARSRFKPLSESQKSYDQAVGTWAAPFRDALAAFAQGERGEGNANAAD